MIPHRPQFILAANSAPPADMTAANSAFQILQRDSLFIPYGDYPHAVGIQRFNRDSAEAIANDMRTAMGKLATRWGGMPIYIGHPDLDPDTWKDDGAYGWVTACNVREDGLDLTVKWTNAGNALIEDGRYKFYSPYWRMVRLSEEGGRTVARPVRLISVGLTNTPNIPVAPVANDARTALGELGANTKESVMDRAKLIALLGLAEDATDQQILDAIQALQAANEQMTADLAAAKEQQQAAEAGKTTAEEVANTLRIARDAAVTNAANARQAHAEILVDSAIAAGKLTLADKANWQVQFKADFAAANTKLGELTPLLSLDGKTRDLSKRKTGVSAGQAFVDAVNTRVKETGESRDLAWANCKRMQPELWNAMRQPEGAIKG